MDDYRLANIFDISRHIQQRINSPFRSAITMYEKARNGKKNDLYAKSPLKNYGFKNNGFQRGIYYIHLGFHRRSSILRNDSIMEKCFKYQENMY